MYFYLEHDVLLNSECFGQISGGMHKIVCDTLFCRV